MKKIIIPNTDLKCSKFIYGTSGLAKVFSKKERLKLLSGAIDKNFSHFDTSPYYGYGLAERDLGEVLKNNTDISVTTKVGLYAPGGSNQSFFKMALRKSMGKIFSSITKPVIDFTINEANKSLEGSLKRLSRDSIDILLIHEPLVELIQTDEWQTWFDKLIRTGKIRYSGLSSILTSRLEKFIFNKKSLFNIIQTPDSIDEMEADFLKKHNLPLQISFRYMYYAKKRFAGKSFSDIFNQTVARNPEGAIIISTKNQKHLSEISKLAESLK